MDYTAVAILLFCVLVASNMLWLASKITNIEKMLTAIIEGGKFALPKINDGMRTMELVIKAAGNVGKAIVERAKQKRRLKNVNKTPVIPDVPDEMLRQFARVLLREIEASVSIGDVSLTETTWITDGKFKELIGGSRKQFTACMDRFEAARIVTRGGGKNTRVWAMPYRSITAKLQKFIRVRNNTSSTALC